jgi:FMN phosphatase YigB (HAD superfamily)
MDAVPERVLFIDDRAENTAAAADLGIYTVAFTSASALRHQLTRASSEPDRTPRNW